MTLYTVPLALLTPLGAIPLYYLCMLAANSNSSTETCISAALRSSSYEVHPIGNAPEGLPEPQAYARWVRVCRRMSA